MLACTRAASGMVLDAPSSNGPFQPVDLMHFRGETRKSTSWAVMCFKGRWVEIRYIRQLQVLHWILQKKIFMSSYFFKSCCERLRPVMICVLELWVFLEEEAGVCVYVSVRKGFAKTLLSSSQWGRENRQCYFWVSHPPTDTPDVIGSENACFLSLSVICIYCIVVCCVSWHMPAQILC